MTSAPRSFVTRVLLLAAALGLPDPAPAQAQPAERAPPPAAKPSRADPDPARSLQPAAAAKSGGPLAEADEAATADPAALSGLLDGAVARLAAAARGEAARMLQQKRFPEALEALETAHELEPGDLDVTQRLAEQHNALGHGERAEALYRELIALAPERAASYLALGDLLARDKQRPDRLEQAAELYARAQERLGSDATLLLRKARLAAARGLFDDAEREYRAYLAGTHMNDDLALELGDFYRDMGRSDEALTHYRRIDAPAKARIAAQRMFELEVDREARRYGLSRNDDAGAQQAGATAEKARLLVQARQLPAAESLLREALRLTPGVASLRADLGDVLRTAGRDAAAELEYLRAIALDGSQPEVYLRLSELYLASRPARAAEAAWLLERALAIRPEWTRPHLLLARAYRVSGDLPRALLHVTRFLSQAAPGPEQDEAAVLQVSLQSALGSSAALPPTLAASARRDDAAEPLQRSSLPAPAERNADAAASGGARAGLALSAGAEHLARARAFLARGQTDVALAELRRLAGTGLGAEAIDLQARVLYAAGRLDEAAEVLDSAPLTAAGQALLGEISIARGEPERARAAFERCAASGLASCSYQLARLDAAPGPAPWGVLFDLLRAPRLFAARARLAELGSLSLSPVSGPELTRLRDEIDLRLRGAGLFALVSGMLLIVIALWVHQLWWGGADLAGLLARHPQAAPDVQRVLAAIRHEVLKHNTLMLAGVADSLRTGADPGPAAGHVARALLGEDGRGGAAERLRGYADKLLEIGRAHGERLNLVRRDPALSALNAGFAGLRGVRARLLEAGQLSGPARRRLAARLRRANEQLNVRGQGELHTLLDTLRSLRLGEPMLRELFERTRNEPALAGEPIADLELDPNSDLPCSVAIPAQAFEDIVINLFRNALQASLRHSAERPIVVGLAVQRELDDVTGLASVMLRVRDRSPERLDQAKLQGGYIEAGLGMTADLVARHEGTLAVQVPEPGWSKAVVLRIPAQRSEAP